MRNIAEGQNPFGAEAAAEHSSTGVEKKEARRKTKRKKRAKDET